MSEKTQQQTLENVKNLNESQPNRASVLNETYNERRTSTLNYSTPNRSMIAVIVYLALLLDNVLLTVIGKVLHILWDMNFININIGGKKGLPIFSSY